MQPLFTPDQLAEVQAYHSARYVAIAVETVSGLLMLALLARFGSRPLYRFSERLVLGLRRPALLDRMWRGPGWAEAVVFAALLFVVVTVLYLPVNTYFGYVREHQFGQSTESLGSYAFDELKQFALTFVAMAALAFGLFGLARRLTTWWLVMGIVGSTLMLLASAADPYRARVYVDQEPLSDGELRERISALMARAQIDFRDVLVEKTRKKSVNVQAYFAGQGPTRTIVLNDALLAAMKDDEVLGAVAHEAGHVRESRWWGRLGSALALLGFLGVVELIFRASARRRWFGVTERADVRTLPLVFLVFELATSAVAPLSGWQSRQRELAADQYALRLTGDLDAFRSMLVKVARINKLDPAPPRWLVWKGLSHPPIQERLDALNQKAEGG